MYKLTPYEELLCKEIVGCAFKVHSQLGPGLLEKIYEACLSYELGKKNIAVERQVYLPVQYDGFKFEEGLRIDLLVENLIVCELKAVEFVNPVWEAQILSHLKLTGNHVGFILNFNVSKIKEGVRRYSRE
jgi:GxxExxY protein